MIVEQRIYTLRPGEVAAYFELYRERGYGVQTEHLGPLVGYYSTDTGTLNQIIHMWAYENMDDRETRRQNLYADQRWKDLVPLLFAKIVKMENRILVPAPFFDPLRPGELPA